MPERIRRSLLFVGADKPDMMRNTVTTDADAIVFDMEDAVTPPNKPEARNNLKEVVQDVSFGSTEICTRINDLRTDYWLEDIRAAVEAGVHTIRMSKVREPWEVRTVVEVARQLTDDVPEVMLSLEDAHGIENGKEIAKTCQQLDPVTAIAFGLEDYTNSVGVTKVSLDIRKFLVQHVAAYASIGNLDALSGGYLPIDDPEGLREWAEQARSNGHVGMPAIHPDQVPIINDVFAPSEDEYERAKKFVDEFDAVEDDGAFMVDGELLEAPTVEKFREIVRRYETIQGAADSS